MSASDVNVDSSRVKYDWYQTETAVVLTIMLKNIKNDDVKIEYSERALSLTVHLQNGSDYNMELDLLHKIVPEQCSHKILPSKIEVKLSKFEGHRWTSLEGTPVEEEKIQPIPQVILEYEKPKYPSSAVNAKDWDKIVGDITKEEEAEKPEGEAALNSLFQKIYSEGSDEVKKQ